MNLPQLYTLKYFRINYRNHPQILQYISLISPILYYKGPCVEDLVLRVALSGGGRTFRRKGY
jgi:hypothetical protein